MDGIALLKIGQTFASIGTLQRRDVWMHYNIYNANYHCCSFTPMRCMIKGSVLLSITFCEMALQINFYIFCLLSCMLLQSLFSLTYFRNILLWCHANKSFEQSELIPLNDTSFMFFLCVCYKCCFAFAYIEDVDICCTVLYVMENWCKRRKKNLENRIMAKHV